MNELSTKNFQRVADLMTAHRDKLCAALPSQCNPERMVRVALTCLRKTPKLLECDPQSLLGAVAEANTYGWELGGVLGHAYLVPFGKEAVMIPGYKGLLDLVHRCGQVESVTFPVIVREGDEFDWGEGDDPFIRHKPSQDPQRDDRPITFVYWSVPLKSGGKMRLVKSIESIRNHRDKFSTSYARAEKSGKRDSAWHTHEAVMAQKTLVREAIGRGMLPVSSEIRSLAGREINTEAALQPTIVDSPIAGLVGERVEETTTEEPTTNSAVRDNWLAELSDELTQADTITAANEIGKSYTESAQNDDEQKHVAACVEARCEEIRQTRGQRSNQELEATATA